jgi:hypothetical protein
MLYITHMPNKVITISLDNWKALDKMRDRIGTEKKYESFNTVISRLLGKPAAAPPKPKPVPAPTPSLTTSPLPPEVISHE